MNIYNSNVINVVRATSNTGSYEALTHAHRVMLYLFQNEKNTEVADKLLDTLVWLHDIRCQIGCAYPETPSKSRPDGLCGLIDLIIRG